MKYTFATPEWFACLHGIIAERAAAVAVQHPDVRFSMCEVFHNVPTSLSNDGTLAWHVVVRGAEVEFGTTERDDVDLKYFADFPAIVPLTRLDTGGSADRAAELTRIVEGMMSRGQLRIVGSRSPGAELIGSFHDAIARLTA